MQDGDDATALDLVRRKKKAAAERQPPAQQTLAAATEIERLLMEACRFAGHTAAADLLVGSDCSSLRHASL